MLPLNCHFCLRPICKSAHREYPDFTCTNCKLMYDVDANNSQYYVGSFFSLKKSIYLNAEVNSDEHMFFYYPISTELEIYRFNAHSNDYNGCVIETTLNYNPNISQLITILSKHIKNNSFL